MNAQTSPVVESTVVDYGQFCLDGGPEDIYDDSGLDPAQLWEMPGYGIPTNTHPWRTDPAAR
ncbi:hypothetical protein [Rhodococcus sp. NPDC058521]|uniref:hypothetical protein n=1 Tax=Rhodococcus sp. NPDC058521 TaxID=3346536 RepID=UPI003646EB73